ncbi:MAG: hypothetical protein AAFQ62_15880 [Pseudomonadota bacterium]
MWKLILGVCVSVVLAGTVVADDKADSEKPEVIVNGKVLGEQTIVSLRNLYGSVEPGNYWYDAMSGLYGNAGGPPMGQLHPGLALGGPLKASASGGGNGNVTGVFINGREIHRLEYLFYLRLFGQVMPGRFWMNAQGVGGYVGGPAFFNVQQALAQAGSRASGGGDSVYMPWIGGKPGTHVGRASDGCVYVSQGGYSAESC